MAFKRVPQKFKAALTEVTLGTGDKAVTIGGNYTYPLYAFDDAVKNRTAVGIELTDAGVDKSIPGIAAAFEGCDTIAAQAAKAATLPGVDFLAIRLENADPNGADLPIEKCVEICKEACDAIDIPLVVEGCKNNEKDAKIFSAVANALPGKNVLFMSAHEDNHKNIAAAVGLACNMKVGAESAVDINLAKQLNVLLGQSGLKNENIVMNLGSAAAGYGFEYVVSTMDRVLAAALAQDDKQLQVPVITPVAGEAWGVKEAIVSEADFPEWGPAEERGIEMEVATAACCMAAGSNAVILKHPKSVQTISELVTELI